jgi:hypothetical protein
MNDNRSMRRAVKGKRSNCRWTLSSALKLKGVPLRQVGVLCLSSLHLIVTLVKNPRLPSSTMGPE